MFMLRRLTRGHIPLAAVVLFAGAALAAAEDRLSEAAASARDDVRQARLARASAARLCYAPGEILAAVAGQMNLTLRPDVEPPAVLMASETPLKRFQDAVERQWGMRPDQILNVYAVSTNEIYLLDDPGYYVRLRRSVDDSLAHECVHYLQVRYRGNSLENDADTLESEAVHFQTWFREEFILSPEGIRRCGPRPPRE